KKCAGEYAGKRMLLGGQQIGRRGGGKTVRSLIKETIGRITQTVAVDGGGRKLSDAPPELFANAREPRIYIQPAAGFRKDRLADRRDVQSAQYRAHVAKRFVKCRRLGVGRVEQLRPQRVEDGVSELVADDIRAFGCIDMEILDFLMEETQAERAGIVCI